MNKNENSFHQVLNTSLAVQRRLIYCLENPPFMRGPKDQTQSEWLSNCLRLSCSSHLSSNADWLPPENAGFPLVSTWMTLVDGHRRQLGHEYFMEGGHR